MKELTERNAQITAEVLSGATLSSVAEHFGITKERVRQIAYRGVNRIDPEFAAQVRWGSRLRRRPLDHFRAWWARR